MKYFDSLPTTKFESSIGSFNICDFFVYIDNAAIPFKPTQTTIDDRSTLLEAAYKVYQDPNSFWAFLLANKTINPFNLLATNVNLFLQATEDKINLKIVGNTAGSTAYTFPKGSIVLPYASNTGGSYSYSSVGNFDLDGGFALIESAYYSDGRMIIKDQKGATYSFIQPYGSTGQQLTVVYPTSGGTYTTQTLLYPYDTKPQAESIVIKYQEKGGVIADVELLEEGPAGSYEAAQGTTGTVSVTALETVQTSSKSINTYLPSDLSTVKTYFISAKYNRYA